MRRVEHRYNNFRILHGNYHVSNARQFGTLGNDGTYSRANTYSYDQGTLTHISAFIEDHFSEQKNRNTFVKESSIGTVTRMMANTFVRIVSP